MISYEQVSALTYKELKELQVLIETVIQINHKDKVRKPGKGDPVVGVVGNLKGQRFTVEKVNIKNFVVINEKNQRYSIPFDGVELLIK